MSPTLVPDGHTAISVLREVAGQRLVVRTRRESGDCTVLVLLTPVPTHFASTLQGVVLRGRGSIEGLPAEVSRTLEGFRVRARIGNEPGLARVVDAGVLVPDEGVEYDGPVPPAGYGFAWVATAWVPGETLEQAWPSLDRDERHAALKGIAERLARLHKYGVFYGDLKPTNVIVHEEQGAVLIDMETLREVPGLEAPVRSLEYTPGYAAPEQEALYEAYLASDVWSFGAVAAAQWFGVPPAEAVRAVTQGLVPSLEGGPLPSTWTTVLAACLRPVPQSRPPAASVVSLLEGEDITLDGFMDAPVPPSLRPTLLIGDPVVGEDETTRVDDPAVRPRFVAETIPQPDPEDDETVGDPPAGQEPSRIISVSADLIQQVRESKPEPSLMGAPDRTETLLPDQTASDLPTEAMPERQRTTIARAFGALLVLALLVAGAFGVQQALGSYRAQQVVQNQAAANALARQVRLDLRRHKTDREHNTQAEIERILETARSATALAPTPDALGVEALALVWSQRWHWSSAKWDPVAWQVADALTRRAIERDPSPEGLMARGMALSASCRLAPESDRRVPAESRSSGSGSGIRVCDRARKRFEAALQVLPREGREAWLTVEALWAAEMLDSALAVRAHKAGKPHRAHEMATSALAHCNAAWPILDLAPVNGDELNEDCVAAAGWSEDYAAYLRWADRLLTRRERTRVKGAVTELARIFKGAGLACVDRDLTKEGLPYRRPEPGSYENLCDYLGTMALGCPAEAEELRRCERERQGICVRYAEAPEVPWRKALAAIRGKVRSSCLLKG